jgi:F-type H+-transporting ATPase subunit b
VGIDWFTFGAQVVNFVILLLLLKRFLYRPVIAAVDRRRERIDERVEAAEEARRTAREERREAAAEREQLEEERARRLQEIEREAEEAREESLAEVREEARAARERWHRALHRERASFLAELRELAAREIQRSVRSVLSEMTGRDIEGEAVDLLVDRLDDLEDDEREAFAEAVRSRDGAVEVRTRFGLPDGQRERLEARLREVVGRPVETRVETAGDVVWGIDLRAGDLKIGWSVASRLDALEEELVDVLEAEYREEAPAEPEGGMAGIAADGGAPEQGGGDG